MNERLAQYMPLRAGELRLDTQWAKISERLPKAPGRARQVALWTLGAGVPMTAAAMLTISLLPLEQPSAWTSSVVRSNESPVEIELSDSEHVEVLPSSEVAFLPGPDASVGLSLEHGSTRLSFGEDSARSFRIRAANYEVVGRQGDVRVTRVVEAGGERLQISVSAGDVQVRRTDQDEAAVQLSAGHHWSAFAAFEKVEKAEETSIEPTEAQPSPPSETTRSERATSKRRRRAEGLSAEAQALFDRANLARRGGQIREAEGLYAEMVSRFARNRRTALAAFELGRIRMDSLSDPKGAIGALEKALELDTRASFAEDALARLAVAYQASGDLAGCKRARDRYREMYPDGVHSPNLERRCGEP